MSDDDYDRESRAENFERLADTARQAREISHIARGQSAQTRWRARKAQLRARRARKGSRATGRRTLDEFVEVASIDELVNVLVGLVEHEGDKRDDERRRRDG